MCSELLYGRQVGVVVTGSQSDHYRKQEADVRIDRSYQRNYTHLSATWCIQCDRLRRSRVAAVDIVVTKPSKSEAACPCHSVQCITMGYHAAGHYIPYAKCNGSQQLYLSLVTFQNKAGHIGFLRRV
jgi:hypothetical protein